MALCNVIRHFPDTSAAGAYPPSGPGGPPSFGRPAPQTLSDDQEVTKATSSVRATGTQTMPPMVEASQGGGVPDVQLFELMEGSLMDADEMRVFASFCTDSGASDEMNVLAKIQEELTSRREGAPDAAGGSSATTPA